MVRTRVDVAVVGLGAMGCAALYHLAQRGVRTLGVERFEPGHERGSSHGESRAIRLGYAEQPFYVPLARAAFEAWRRLGHDSGEQILVETGLLEMGRPGSPAVAGTRLACEEHGLPFDLLSASEIRAHYPVFAPPDDFAAIRQPKESGGFVRADLGNVAHLRLAQAHGAYVETQCRVTAIEPRQGAIRLVAGDRTIEADRVVICAGGWMNAFVPSRTLPLVLTRQVVCWFAPERPDLVSLGRLPVFFIDGQDDGVYGFPFMAGFGLKCASHQPGPSLASADDAAQDAGPQDGAAMAAFLRRYLPGASGPLTAMKTCIYTSTPDGDFVIDRLPADERIIIVSACSGHGYKFAPVIGEIAADLATQGSTRHNIAPFRIDRPALSKD